jgi:hypothetical protein
MQRGVDVVERGDMDSKAELDAEGKSLRMEHLALMDEHQRVHENALDSAAHFAHARNLFAYVGRLRAYIERLQRAIKLGSN